MAKACRHQKETKKTNIYQNRMFLRMKRGFRVLYLLFSYNQVVCCLQLANEHFLQAHFSS